MHTSRLLFAIFVLFALSACASRPVVTMRDAHGVAVFGEAQRAQKIFPVRVTVVDGDNVSDRKTSLLLTPGRHTLRLLALIDDATMLSPGPYRKTFLEDGVLEIEIEEGKRYLIGAKLLGPRRRQWQPVIFATQDIKGYNQR